MPKKHYLHLSYEQRCQIYALKKRGISQSAIAEQLGVHKSTISRELKRNRGQCGYQYKQAHRSAVNRRQTASKQSRKLTPALLDLIKEKLTKDQWSPEQLSAWLKETQSIKISHEWIYQVIWQDKHQGDRL